MERRIMKANFVGILAGLMVVLGFGLLGGGSSAFAAKVAGLQGKKRLVKIDQGSGAGFTKGANVCFFAKTKKKVACGKVVIAKEKYAVVRVSAKRFKFVKKGMQAKLSGGSAGAVATETPAEDGKEEAKPATGVTDHRRNFKLGYVISALTPAVFNKLTYQAPTLDSENAPEGGQSSLWKVEGANSLSIFGFNLESEFGMLTSHAIAVGLRYVFYRDFIAQADYDKTNIDLFVESEQSATALGLYVDYTFLDLGSGPIFFRSSGGLDIDMSTQSFKATQKDAAGGDSTEIASATTKLTVISLRLGANLNWMLLDPIGMVFGLNVLVPATTFGGSFSGSVNDSNEQYLSSADASKDLEEQIGHKKNGVGAEVTFAAYFAF